MPAGSKIINLSGCLVEHGKSGWDSCLLQVYHSMRRGPTGFCVSGVKIKEDQTTNGYSCCGESASEQEDPEKSYLMCFLYESGARSDNGIGDQARFCSKASEIYKASKQCSTNQECASSSVDAFCSKPQTPIYSISFLLPKTSSGTQEILITGSVLDIHRAISVNDYQARGVFYYLLPSRLPLFIENLL